MQEMRIARCACGSVGIEASGTPITSVVCYCDSCQEGYRQIEALTKASPDLKTFNAVLNTPPPCVPGLDDRVRVEAVEVDAYCLLLALPPEEEYRVIAREEMLDR